MGAYSGVGACLSKWVLGEGAYSGGGVIREWGLIWSFTVFIYHVFYKAWKRLSDHAINSYIFYWFKETFVNLGIIGRSLKQAEKCKRRFYIIMENDDPADAPDSPV